MRKFVYPAIAVLSQAIPAFAETPQCAPHSDVVATLAEKYDEHQVALGTETRGPLVEVFVSVGGTWTLIVTTPNNMACLVAAGENWMMVEWPPSDDLEG